MCFGTWGITKKHAGRVMTCMAIEIAATSRYSVIVGACLFLLQSDSFNHDSNVSRHFKHNKFC